MPWLGRPRLLVLLLLLPNVWGDEENEAVPTLESSSRDASASSSGRDASDWDVTPIEPAVIPVEPVVTPIEPAVIPIEPDAVWTLVKSSSGMAGRWEEEEGVGAAAEATMDAASIACPDAAASIA